MSLFRCAACGSPNVVTDTQTGGVSYNYKKGVVGTVVLGVGGAVAGIESKTQQVFKCKDCGITLTYAMPEKIKSAIELGLISEEARSQLNIEGVGQVSWEILKKQYKNIEEGIADRVTAVREEYRKEGLLAYATATQEEFDKAVDLIVDFDHRLADLVLSSNSFSDEKPMTLSEYYVWMDAINLVIENSAKYLPSPLKSYRGLNDIVLKTYFATYLCEKLRLEYDQYEGISDCAQKESNREYEELLKNYTEDHPFILLFAQKYFNWSSVDSFIAYRRRAIHLRMIYFLFKNRRDEDIRVSRIVPRFVVEDGRLCFWQGSNPRAKRPNATNIMEEYFAVYPQKRAEFQDKIFAYEQQCLANEKIEQEMISIKDAVANNERKIKTNNLEITQLQKKIFGKKAALIKAAELEREVLQIEKNNNEFNANIGKLESQLTQLNDWQFYDQLVQEMDNFLVWSGVEE